MYQIEIHLLYRVYYLLGLPGLLITSPVGV